MEVASGNTRLSLGVAKYCGEAMYHTTGNSYESVIRLKALAYIRLKQDRLSRRDYIKFPARDCLQV